VPNTRSTQGKGLIDVADDNDLRCTFRERDGAVVKARKTSMITTAPTARSAPANRLSIRISIGVRFLEEVPTTSVEN
jgi:hypothetical protein